MPEFPPHPPLQIEAVRWHRHTLRLVQPFRAAYGQFREVVHFFPELTFRTPAGANVVGVGECPPLPAPWYDSECHGTCLVGLRHLRRALLTRPDPITDVYSLLSRYQWVIGHKSAKVGIEGAYWDAVGKVLEKPVWNLWGGDKTSIPVGVTLGMRPPQLLLQDVRTLVAQHGLVRIKLKISPGRDLEEVTVIRNAFPELPLLVDANGSYQLDQHTDRKCLAELDRLGLAVIEQPVTPDALRANPAALCAMTTAIGLDESIQSPADARFAITQWRAHGGDLAKLMINIKPARVGGYLTAMKIAADCTGSGVRVWCGGMYESVLGKCANLHLCSGPEWPFPGDHMAAGPYFGNDVAPPLVVSRGHTQLPEAPGWGITGLLF